MRARMQAALVSVPLFSLTTLVFGAEPAANPASGELVDSVIVIGSRGIARTDVDRPVPVDVVSAQDLQATGQTDLAQQVQFNSPSFNSAKYGVNGTTNY